MSEEKNNNGQDKIHTIAPTRPGIGPDGEGALLSKVLADVREEINKSGKDVFRVKNPKRLAQEGFTLLRSFHEGRLKVPPTFGPALAEVLHNFPVDDNQVKHNLTGQGILYFCELFPEYDYLNQFVEVKNNEDN